MQELSGLSYPGWHFPMPAVRSRSPFSLGFAIPSLHAFRGGVFRWLCLDWGVDRYG